MEYQEIINELLDWKKDSLCELIEVLMERKKLDITDINLCHTRALERKLAKKDQIIQEADNCIFNSFFSDILGKSGDSVEIMRKYQWMERTGMHNMEGIREWVKEQKKEVKDKK